MSMSAQKEDWVIAIKKAGFAIAALARYREPTRRSFPPDQHFCRGSHPRAVLEVELFERALLLGLKQSFFVPGSNALG
jgi:hypothetical protein